MVKFKAIALFATCLFAAVGCADPQTVEIPAMGGPSGKADDPNAVMCGCLDEGATAQAVEGCEDWVDANSCDGWAKVVCGGSSCDAGEMSYEDGTEFTHEGCTIKLVCPES